MNEEEISQEESTPQEIEITQAPAQKEEGTIDQASMEELKKMLRGAVNNEDYELAARIRDEIEKRCK